MGKLVARGLLGIYIVILIWLVLFKFSFNLPAWLDRQQRSLNLIPFAAPALVNGGINYREIIDNCIVFIPFGLLLSVNFKRVGLVSKLASIFAFSLTAEVSQYIFAIGAADITDVLTNTLGGFLGLKFYDFGRRFIREEKVDRGIIWVGTLLLVVFLSVVALILRRRF